MQGLESVDLPEHLQSIGLFAFYKCEALRALWIPRSVTVVGSAAFSYCSSLQCVVWNKTDGAALGYAAFAGCPLTDCDAIIPKPDPSRPDPAPIGPGEGPYAALANGLNRIAPQKKR